MKFISNDRPEIKHVIIDDAQYIMANEFMRRALEKGFDKFSEMGMHFWNVLYHSVNLRDDLIVIVLSHSEHKENMFKMKTLGKLLDDKIQLEGMFTIILHSIVDDEKYIFLTQTKSNYLAKSPDEMFEEIMIPNNLQIVVNKINSYYENEFTDVPQ